MNDRQDNVLMTHDARVVRLGYLAVIGEHQDVRWDNTDKGKYAMDGARADNI